MTLRPSTEWVDTVEVGANVLVDDDPDAIAAGRRERRVSRRRTGRSTATATPPNALRPPCTLDRRGGGRRLAIYDVAVIGAGYVGVPLAATFAEAGGRVLLVDIQTEVVDALNERAKPHRGRLLRAARAADRDGQDRRHDRLRAASSTRTPC